MSARALVSQKATYTIQEAATVDIFFKLRLFYQQVDFRVQKLIAKPPQLDRGILILF